ncbi:conserved region of rad21 / rec8 like protein [Ditylenchus destructor]|nr:conserved region of rad21 / rec8 like protein [Ditylenchus destructor]
MPLPLEIGPWWWRIDWNPNTPFVPEPDEDNVSANQENLEPQDAEVPNGAMPTPASEKRGSGRKSRLQEKDEIGEDEDDEHLISRRTKGILHSIVVKLKANDDKIVFEDLFTRGSTRRTAAQKFYALLELHKWQAIEVEQSEPYAPIEIMPGQRMEEALTAAAFCFGGKSERTKVMFELATAAHSAERSTTFERVNRMPKQIVIVFALWLPFIVPWQSWTDICRAKFRRTYRT